MVMVLLPFEVQHGVNDVLKGLGPGERPVFSDMADDEGGDAAGLGQEQKLSCDFADLRDRARRGSEFRRVDGLDGVDDKRCGLQHIDLLENVLERGLGHQEKRAAGETPDGRPAA